MWTRVELKEKAKLAIKKPKYWMSVLSAFILTFFASGSGSAAGRQANSANTDYTASEGYDGLMGIIFLAILLAALSIVLVLAIVKIIIGNALIVGAQKVLIDNELVAEPSPAGKLIFVFKNGYWKNVALTMFLKDLFTGLWTLLLVIPGVIKAYEYRMIPFILAENPDMDRKEVFAKSKQMMDGEKWNSFVLDLSFIGWHILSIITIGILGIFYVNPYHYQTIAELYLVLKEK